MLYRLQSIRAVSLRVTLDWPVEGMLIARHRCMVSALKQIHAVWREAQLSGFFGLFF